VKIPILFLQGERDYQVTMKILNYGKYIEKQYKATLISYPNWIIYSWVEGQLGTWVFHKGNIETIVVDDIIISLEKINSWLCRIFWVNKLKVELNSFVTSKLMSILQKYFTFPMKRVQIEKENSLKHVLLVVNWSTIEFWFYIYANAAVWFPQLFFLLQIVPIPFCYPATFSIAFCRDH
jgi:hypothetical protein